MATLTCKMPRAEPSAWPPEAQRRWRSWIAHAVRDRCLVACDRVHHLKWFLDVQRLKPRPRRAGLFADASATVSRTSSASVNPWTARPAYASLPDPVEPRQARLSSDHPPFVPAPAPLNPKWPAEPVNPRIRGNSDTTPRPSPRRSTRARARSAAVASRLSRPGRDNFRALAQQVSELHAPRWDDQPVFAKIWSTPRSCWSVLQHGWNHLGAEEADVLVVNTSVHDWPRKNR